MTRVTMSILSSQIIQLALLTGLSRSVVKQMTMLSDGAVVILAAGLGSRIGGPKANLKLGDSTFLECCLSMISELQFGFSVVVVNSAIAQTAKQLLPNHYSLLVNSEPQSGQMGSLRLALEAGAAKFRWTLVLLVDLPGVNKTTITSLVTNARQQPSFFWVPSYQGRRGHPVIYCQSMYGDLLTGPSDRGARWAVQRHIDLRREVSVDDPFILRDVDTPSDYQEILGLAKEDE